MGGEGNAQSWLPGGWRVSCTCAAQQEERWVPSHGSQAGSGEPTDRAALPPCRLAASPTDRPTDRPHSPPAAYLARTQHANIRGAGRGGGGQRRHSRQRQWLGQQGGGGRQGCGNGGDGGGGERQAASAAAARRPGVDAGGRGGRDPDAVADHRWAPGTARHWAVQGEREARAGGRPGREGSAGRERCQGGRE